MENNNNEQNLKFSDYIVILLRGRWIILFSLIIIFGYSIYSTFTATPIYRASAKVMIKENKSMQRAIFNINSYMKRETMINNQIEILKSRTLMEKVARQLMASSYADKLYLLGYQRKGNSRKNSFGAKFRRNFASLFSFEEDSEKVKHAPTASEIAGALRGGIEIIPVRDTDVIQLAYRAPSAFEAAYITNTISEIFKESNQLESQEEVRQVKNFLQEQLDLIKNKLNISETALKDYKEKMKLVGLPEEVQELIKKLTEFESHYQAAKLEQESFQQRLEYVNNQLSKTKKNIDMDNVLTSPVLDELKQQMALLQSKKAKLSAGLIVQGVYSDSNPEITKIDERLNSLKEKFKATLAKLASAETLDPIQATESLFARRIEIEAELQSLEPKVTELGKIVNQYNSQLERLPEKSLRLARLERSAKVDEKIYLMMKEKYEESRITEVGQLGNIRIIDLAKEPRVPISPNKRVNLMLGLILGLGLGVGIVFVREYLDDSIRSIEDIQRIGMPLLASIPEIQLDKAMKKIKIRNPQLQFKGSNTQEIETMISRMISHFAPKSPIAEAYRTLRTNLQYSKSDKELKSFLVTSPGPREGKSTTIVNLAITIAQTGKKTLLIDSDLRRPVIHSIFGTDKGQGLSNCIIGKSELMDVVQATEINNLHILPCGTLPPNPSELLASNSMKQLLERMKENFEMVLFDSPPIIAVTDAAVLSSILDGVILVYRFRQTNRNAAKRAFELMKSVDAPLLGAILNNVQVESMYGSYYYYYHYYYYYGKDKEKRKRRRAA